MDLNLYSQSKLCLIVSSKDAESRERERKREMENWDWRDNNWVDLIVIKAWLNLILGNERERERENDGEGERGRENQVESNQIKDRKRIELERIFFHSFLTLENYFFLSFSFNYLPWSLCPLLIDCWCPRKEEVWFDLITFNYFKSLWLIAMSSLRSTNCWCCSSIQLWNVGG